MTSIDASSGAAAITVPAALHDVFGERTRRIDLALILVAGGLVGTLFVMQTSFAGLAWWRVALALALVVDIAAGAIANLTRGTNDYYVQRPLHRWGFIAIHVHVLVLSWALGAPLAQAIAVWAFTIGSASVVNLLLGHESQSSIAGLLVTSGTAVTLMWEPSAPAPLLLVYLLFLFKVVFSFAVDHHAARADRARTGVQALCSRDRAHFIELIVAAFCADPLFVRLFPGDDERAAGERRAFVSFVLDLNRVLGGTPRGLFVDGRLVAAWLLEPPLSGWKRGLAAGVAVLRGLPLLLRLGARRMQWLNRYGALTRASMPDGPWYYLVMIGVVPECQGRGYGTRALCAISEEVGRDEGARGVGLDTENARNVPLYEHFGFEVVGAHALDEAVTAQCMVKRTA